MSKPRALVDEDLPRLIGDTLRDLGWTVQDVRDVGLRGRNDEDIIRFARRRKAVLFTADRGFVNIVRYPFRRHVGIVMLHYPNEVTVASLAYELRKALDKLQLRDIAGNLVIIEPGKIRVRRE